RQFVFQRGGALELDQFGGLAAVQPGADPGRLFAGDALPVEEIHRAVELQQHAAERFQFDGQIGAERKRRGGNPPIHVGEQAAFRKLLANETSAAGGGRGRTLSFGWIHVWTIAIPVNAPECRRPRRGRLCFECPGRAWQEESGPCAETVSDPLPTVKSERRAGIRTSKPERRTGCQADLVACNACNARFSMVTIDIRPL